MRDPRLDKLARVLVEYSTEVKPGQRVRITGEPVTLPLMEAIAEAVIRAGAHVIFRCTPGSISELLFEHGSDEQLQYVDPLNVEEIKQIDVSIGLWGSTNTKAMSNVDPKKQGLASAARRPVFKVFMERSATKELRWTGTMYPTEASAQDAEMSLREYEEFVFNAGHLNEDDPVAAWLAIRDRQQAMTDYMNNSRKEVRFQASNGTDLLVNVEGMKWINCCGNENFPDGEVFTGPNLQAADGGVNGYVKYHYPAVHSGREVHGIELWFERGRVVKAKAEKNEEYLLAMLDQDEGARGLGEIAIGTNYQIAHYTKNTLFDEKIGGTFHAAVGAGYPETGNRNESGLHWDMVCDLREGGTITVDGEMISKDGQFVFDGWPGEG